MTDRPLTWEFPFRALQVGGQAWIVVVQIPSGRRVALAILNCSSEEEAGVRALDRICEDWLAGRLGPRTMG